MTIIKETVEKWCCQDINVYSADIAIKFMLDKYNNLNHFLRRAFLNELIVRIK